MKTEWKQELTSEEPSIFQKLNPTTYMQRKNIIKTENGYSCESRKISKEIYGELQDQATLIAQIVAQTATVDQEYKDAYTAAMILLGGEE